MHDVGIDLERVGSRLLEERLVGDGADVNGSLGVDGAEGRRKVALGQEVASELLGDGRVDGRVGVARSAVRLETPGAGRVGRVKVLGVDELLVLRSLGQAHSRRRGEDEDGGGLQTDSRQHSLKSGETDRKSVV